MKETLSKTVFGLSCRAVIAGGVIGLRGRLRRNSWSFFPSAASCLVGLACERDYESRET
jgi:hypothetical protein